MLIAFVKECFHNAVEIDSHGIFGRQFIVTNLAPPNNSSGANSSGANDVIAIDHVLCLSRVFLHVSGRLVCLSSQLTVLGDYRLWPWLHRTPKKSRGTSQVR